ncbi:MAG: hypothetical protein O2816_18325 [Planctomycetota bacterium]|nr:hypothetical protein [Planctomycetota bacterium]
MRTAALLLSFSALATAQTPLDWTSIAPGPGGLRSSSSRTG